MVAGAPVVPGPDAAAGAADGVAVVVGAGPGAVVVARGPDAVVVVAAGAVLVVAAADEGAVLVVAAGDSGAVVAAAAAGTDARATVGAVPGSVVVGRGGVARSPAGPRAGPPRLGLDGVAVRDPPRTAVRPRPRTRASRPRPSDAGVVDDGPGALVPAVDGSVMRSG